MRVLLVDDHPLFQSILSTTVRAALDKCDVYVANTLEEALGFARHHEFDLVLLDLLLPGYHGIESLQGFLRECPGTRVAIVSAIDDASVVQAALRAGAIGYIPKTSQPNEVIVALRQIASGGTYVPAKLQDG